MRIRLRIWIQHFRRMRTRMRIRILVKLELSFPKVNKMNFSHLIFLPFNTFRVLDQVLCLKYEWIENTYFHIFSVYILVPTFILFRADFPLSGSIFVFAMRIQIKKPMRTQCRSRSGSETLAKIMSKLRNCDEDMLFYGTRYMQYNKIL
jgi:hypothetical protein